MKIYVLGSNSFMREMVDAKNALREAGFDSFIHPHYEELVSGKRPEDIVRIHEGEHAEIKRKYDYFREHYRNILASHAILIVNGTKRGIQNYIGGNVLIEMGQAYVNDKKIFFLNGMPVGLSYQDEIEAMDPIPLNGDILSIRDRNA